MFSSEAFAVASTCCNAVSSMILSELKGRMPLLQVARWQMLSAFLMTASVSLVIEGWRSIGVLQFWQLAGSSVAGNAIAGAAFLGSIYTLGPRITALFFSLTAPIALMLGYVTFGETVSATQALGIVAVLSGVVLAIGVPNVGSGKPSLRTTAPGDRVASMRVVKGLALGLILAAGQALSGLLARPAMAAGVEPFSAMALRTGIGTLFFFGISALPLGVGVRAPFELHTVGMVVAAAFFGTAVGTTLLLAALHSGNVGIVATLSSMTPIVILPMVWLRTGRIPSVKAWIGAALAVTGTALISVR